MHELASADDDTLDAYANAVSRPATESAELATIQKPGRGSSCPSPAWFVHRQKVCGDLSPAVAKPSSSPSL
jgi:hypothetical protein